MLRLWSYICLVSGLLLVIPEVKGQINIDSLQNKLYWSKPDSTTITNYIHLANNLSPEENEAAMIIGNWALEKSIKKRYKYLTLLSYKAIGSSYFKVDKYVDANKFFIKALKISEGEKEKYIEEQVDLLRLISGFYSKNRQEPKAIEYLEKCIPICKKNNLRAVLGKVYMSLSSIAANLDFKYDTITPRAINYFKMGLPLIEEMKDTLSLIKAYSVLSQIYVTHQQYDSAIYSLDKAKPLFTNPKFDDAKITHYMYKAGVYNGQGKYRLSIASFFQALPISKRLGTYSHEYLIYKNLSVVFESVNDYEKANYYAKRYIQLHDSIIGTENFIAAADIQNKYEREKKEKEILRLNKDNEIKKLELNASDQKRSQLNIFLISSLAILMLLTILSIMLLRNIQSRKKAYTKLKQTNADIQRQTIQLNKQSRLIAQFQSQMNPHFVFNALNNVQGLVLSSENKRATKQIQSLAQLMRRTFSNAEKEEITIQEEVTYLKQYLEFEQSALEYKINFRIDTQNDTDNALIPPMMIQPFVENCIKHGELKTISDPFIKVKIEAKNELLCITIEDNGVGFDVDKEDPTKISHSVSVIKSRIELFFQSANKTNHTPFKTTSKPGEGTTVKFHLPYNEPF